MSNSDFDMDVGPDHPAEGDPAADGVEDAEGPEPSKNAFKGKGNESHILCCLLELYFSPSLNIAY
jgi:hypothetical protein